MNNLKTLMLFAFLTGLLVILGDAIGGRGGMIFMLGMAFVMNIGTWFFSDTMAIKSSGAVPAPRGGDLDWLHQDLEEISQKANMPTPKLYVIPHEMSPNAFATGRSPSKGVVAVTQGIMNLLDREQLKGVLAHEVGHIQNRDTLVSSIAATMAGALTMVTRMGGMGRGRRGNPLIGLIGMFVAPMGAAIIKGMVSQTREYMADERAARLTGNPEALATALEALQGGVTRQPMTTGRETQHYIVNGFMGGMSKLMSTHPPIEERAKKLRELQL